MTPRELADPVLEDGSRCGDLPVPRYLHAATARQREGLRVLRSLGAQGPDWRVIAGAIAEAVEQSSADLEHPWATRWPTEGELAGVFGVTRKTLRRSVHFLADQGVLEKARVPFGKGVQDMWVPQARAAAFAPRPTEDEIASEILAKGLSGEWAVLPAQRVLAGHFGVDRATIVAVTRGLAQRGLVGKVCIGGQLRWRIIEPHQAQANDAGLAAPPDRVLVADLIRRILAGEFRYQLTDGTVHERPFLTHRELNRHYEAGQETIAKAKALLYQLNLIRPGERSNAPARLTEHVPPVNLAVHPGPRPARNPALQHKRARGLADDLIDRIRAGEFTDRPFPSQKELQTTHHIGRRNVQAAFGQLARDGWIEWRHSESGRTAVVAQDTPTLASETSDPHASTPAAVPARLAAGMPTAANLTSVPVVLTEATPPPSGAPIAAELRVLRKGWGVQSGQRAERVGPMLRQMCGIAECDSPIDMVADWLRDTIPRLPHDLLIAALGAFGLHEHAQSRFLQDRVSWVAEQLDRDCRTARRRINSAIDALADLAVQRTPPTVDLRGLVGRRVELTCSPCGIDDDQITRQGHLIALAHAFDHPDRCLVIVDLPGQQPRTIAIPTARILSAASLDEPSLQPADDQPTGHTHPHTEEKTVTEPSPQPEGTRRR